MKIYTEQYGNVSILRTNKQTQINVLTLHIIIHCVVKEMLNCLRKRGLHTKKNEHYFCVVASYRNWNTLPKASARYAGEG